MENPFELCNGKQHPEVPLLAKNTLANRRPSRTPRDVGTRNALGILAEGGEPTSLRSFAPHTLGNAL
jgi:hypothetical protein